MRRRQAAGDPSRPWRAAAIVLLLGGLLAGCAAHDRTPYRGDSGMMPPPLARIATSAFDYLAGKPAPRAPIVGEDHAYRVRALAIPSSGHNGQQGNLVTARYYESKLPGAGPLVIVLPIWGIHDYPSDTLARDLRERSGGTISVLQILGERPLFDWEAIGRVGSEAAFFGRVDQMVERFVATVIDIRRLVDWAEGRPEVDPRRIALVGFSMSALVASVALANEPRLAAGVLVMGGADLHDVLASCNHEIADARERILERLDWSLERFRDELRRELEGINPAGFAGMTDPSRLLIIEAGADTCMPQSARDRLWHAFGRPERIAYRYDHRAAFLAMTFLGGHDLQRQVYRFLARTLADTPDRQLTGNDAAASPG